MSEAKDFSDIGLDSVQKRALENKRVVILAARWHADIVNQLVADAREELARFGIEKNVEVRYVPGCFELPQASAILLEKHARYWNVGLRYVTNEIAGVICFGCVVQGETPHFTFIAQSAADNLSRVSCRYRVPVMFGVLTTNTVEQAKARADGTHSRKGLEVANALVQMLVYSEEFKPNRRGELL